MKMKKRAMLVLAVLAIAAVAALPASAQTITATSPTIDFALATQYMFGFFNLLGPAFWPLFGISLVGFLIALIWRLKPRG
jgi:hypothetical protein